MPLNSLMSTSDGNQSGKDVWINNYETSGDDTEMKTTVEFKGKEDEDEGSIQEGENGDKQLACD